MQAGESLRDRARAAIRAAGMRWTSQRETLMDVIERAEGHQDADDIYRQARERDPKISLSTVYRMLGVLKRQGLVSELHLAEEHHHYEPTTAEEHFHMVCTSCGAVIEFGGGTVDLLRQEIRRQYDFLVDGIELDVSGRCVKCAASEAHTNENRF
jgi:Fe2+ or Zn2+ uptake regulation protein